MIKVFHKVSLLDLVQHRPINGSMIIKYNLKVWDRYGSTLCINRCQFPIYYMHHHDGGKGMVDYVSSKYNMDTMALFIGVESHGVYFFCLVGIPHCFSKCDEIMHY